MMNFFNQFADIWGSRFPGVIQPPDLDCLKADQFGSLSEQKHALEFEETKRTVLIEELRQQLNHETFVVDFLHKCVQKLGAVSQVFSEIDQSDSKSSSSSGTTSRCPGSSSSPPLSLNGSNAACNKFLPPTPSSNFSLFPHCIASSLIHSASPLLAAAAATPSTSFLLSSNLPSFPCADSMKLDPDSESLNGGSTSNFLFSSTDRSSYDAISRLTVPSSLYNNNPFTNGPTFPSHSLRSQSTPFDGRSKDEGPTGPISEHAHPMTSSSEAQAQAAAAVAAAFGLGFPTVRAGRNGSNQLPGYNRPEVIVSSGSGAFQSTSLRHSPTPIGFNGKDNVADSSVERPYQCTTCSRSFAVKAGLVQHMRTHTDERPYPCVHCGRAFKQKIQLTTHMRVHSGERPYGCRLCGKLFRQQSHVVQHLRTHTGEKPHKCYQCGKAFRQKYSLISHQRRMCRNRTASNPIAAGMTMWISPGVGGDTCNLVKEFSPARSTLATTTASLTSPNPSVTTSVQSPFSPYHVSSPGGTSSQCQTAQFPNFPNHRHLEESHTQTQHPHHMSFPSTNLRSRMAPVYRHKSEVRETSHAKPDHNEKRLGSDAEGEEDEEEEEVDDEDETDMCSTRSSTLSVAQKTTALGLS